MFLKIHHSSGGDIVGICDQELIGCTVQEGDVRCIISPSFFGDAPVDEEKVLAALRSSDNITIFGERSVQFAIKHGYLDGEDIRTIGNVPYATIIRL